MTAHFANDGYGVTIRITHDAPKLIAAIRALCAADEIVGNGMPDESQHTAAEFEARCVEILKAYKDFCVSIDCDTDNLPDALNGYQAQLERHEEAARERDTREACRTYHDEIRYGAR